MFHGTAIELSTAALRSNLAFIRCLLGPHTRLCTVVKGNAYGHGLDPFAGMAQQLGVDCFAVYSAFEALDLHGHLAPGAQLYIMGDCDGDALEWAVEHGISFNVFERSRLQHAIAAGQRLGKPARVHIEVETGMHRTGFPLVELDAVFNLCRANRGSVEVVGLCSHLAGAESQANRLRIDAQKEAFQQALQQQMASGLTVEWRHLACSAGVLNERGTLYDMARVGILHYGFWPNEETRKNWCKAHGIQSDPLKRVIRWRSRVMSVSTVEPGGFVGYGSSYQAQRPVRIATIPVGYAYGYARSLSNTGHVLVRGQRAPVRGIVNMNCITVEVTGIPGVQKGDEVVLVGNQGTESITVASFSDLSAQLNYELLSRLPAHIPRTVVESHHA